MAILVQSQPIRAVFMKGQEDCFKVIGDTRLTGTVATIPVVIHFWNTGYLVLEYA